MGERSEQQSQTSNAGNATRFAERYTLHEQLGRGGMASVHRAVDLSTGQSVALKQLLPIADDVQRGHVERLFEREFHTLAQLNHPRVIAVYDYGVSSEGNPFYTMELLDGGDLRQRAPLPWAEACKLVFEVCSSLALLHSRRLLHRDISPRNIRCTSEGNAKLIDFGAMAPMTGGGGSIVGTPAFTPPETLHRSALDARSDLYSLGASLYYALTGHAPYSARTFGELFAAWNHRAAPPSVYVAGIPRALDELVLSLISLEPALRPPSAFAVMQRLAAIAGLDSQESSGVSQAYLSTPMLVGRDVLLTNMRDRLVRTLVSGGNGVMLCGASGLGRSRLLDACALEAKTLGARVLRATASGATQSFDVAFALAEHLVEALPNAALADQFPQLFEPMTAGATVDERPRLRPRSALLADAEHLPHTIAQLMRTASKVQALVLAVDDVHRIDEPSAAVLAALMDKTRRGRMFVALTAEAGATSSPALDALSRRCELQHLEPLTEEETHRLFSSVFGDVPNLALVAGEIHRLAHGNPRLSIDLAQHLVDRGVITYSAGTWTLPRSVSGRDLPKSAEEAIRGRIERLGPLARSLAEAHALSFVEQLAHEDYRELAPGLDTRAVDSAIDELVALQLIVGDGQSYAIANRTIRSALELGLAQADREQAHAKLSEFFRIRGHAAARIHHGFAAGVEQEERALDVLLEVQGSTAIEQNSDAGKLARSYPRALEIARRLNRPPRQLQDLRRWLCATSIMTGDSGYYWLVASPWLSQLIHDTGLDLWRQDAQTPDASARLTQALTRAFERHQATPAAERVYRVDEAIPLLAEYVAISIATGARAMDWPLLRTLPELLAPFAPLSPVLEALWQNAVSTVEVCDCRYEQARARWIEVYDKLANVTGDEVRHVAAIRNAIAYGVGILEAHFGLVSATTWADLLDGDPLQEVTATYVRKIVRLEQGDWPGAEKLQRRAEVLALRARVPQMFSALAAEISAHALALDLAGVKHVIQRERAEAALAPGWLPYVADAEGRFELVRGDDLAARACFERAIALSALDENLHSEWLPVWVAAQGGLCEVLLNLERTAEARDVAVAALAVCDELEIVSYSSELRRLLALAEAKLGDVPAAVARLEQLIAAQLKLGVTGLRLGLSYESRAQIAIWSGDKQAFEEYAQLTAREYRHGANCPLGARYERLVNEARRSGFQAGVALDDFALTTMAESSLSGAADVQSVVLHALGDAKELSERYLRALRLVCRSRAAHGGHLYVPASDGVRLVASCDLAKPAEPLAQRVSEYLEQEEDRFDTLTIVAELTAPTDSANATAQRTSVDGVDYELLLLSCVHDQTPRIAGVVAIAPAAQPVRNPKEPQLLSIIAAQLVGT